MRDGIGVQRDDARHEPPLGEKAALVVDPCWRRDGRTRSDVLGHRSEQRVVPGITGSRRRVPHEAITVFERCPLEDLDEPECEPHRRGFVTG